MFVIRPGEFPKFNHRLDGEERPPTDNGPNGWGTQGLLFRLFFLSLIFCFQQEEMGKLTTNDLRPSFVLFDLSVPAINESDETNESNWLTTNN